ncbi:F-box only protein 50 isoform X1 [Orcinus orca]|uniref:F-box only protein 50 isoform X1 n=1 Tax=Orcinus orca TaxID=9733 RepID=UPI0021123AB7|nr:F-box only protein 50 isoform X1 [Orcinus orca]
MEEVREGPALGGGMEEPSSTQELPSPPPPPSPPSPAAPETPGLPVPEQPTEGYAQQLLLQEWAPPGGSLELPPRLTWKLLFLQRPLYRNLLRSPNPEGINIYEPAPPTGPTQQPLETLGNFRGWHIKTEKLQQGLSWTVKQQSVDLLAEGLWEELLDVEQPNITVMDWYVPLHHRPAQPGRTQALPEAPASRHPPRDPPAAAGPSPAHLCGPFSLSPFLQCASPEAVPSSLDVATLFSGGEVPCLLQESGHVAPPGSLPLAAPRLCPMHYPPAPRISPISGLTIPVCHCLVTCPPPPPDHESHEGGVWGCLGHCCGASTTQPRCTKWVPGSVC